MDIKGLTESETYSHVADTMKSLAEKLDNDFYQTKVEPAIGPHNEKDWAHLVITKELKPSATMPKIRATADEFADSMEKMALAMQKADDEIMRGERSINLQGMKRWAKLFGRKYIYRLLFLQTRITLSLLEEPVPESENLFRYWNYMREQIDELYKKEGQKE